MSSCRNINFRAASGLAILTSARPTISARPSSNPRSLIPIPVRSQNSASSTVVVPAAQSSIRSRFAAPSTVAPRASSSSKTESSVLKHIERLRKTRAAAASFKTAIASKPKPAESVPAQTRPAMRPALRVPSTESSSSSSSARDRSIDAHVRRITSARRGRVAPTTSSRSTPPLRRRVVSTPALRSCLKTVGSTTVVKHVSFINYGVWNLHRVRARIPDLPPSTLISLDEVTLLQPTSFEIVDGRFRKDRPARSSGLVHPGDYSLIGRDHEIRAPPPESDYPVKDCQLLPRCLACATLASRGSPLIRYLPGAVSVWCSDCMSDSIKRLDFSPALEVNEEKDDCNTCPDGDHANGSCHYHAFSMKANLRWLYANYPDRYPQVDAILDG